MAKQMTDKTTTMAQVMEQIKDGDTIYFSGYTMMRKPMAFVRAIANSPLKDLTLAAWSAGPDFDLLLGMGKAKKIIYSSVGFDQVGLAPNFRRLRQQGAIEAIEHSEYLMILALDAAVKRLPFLPTHAGLGTDLLKINPTYKVFDCPITGQKLVAVPPLHIDVALIHVNYADTSGYGQIVGDTFVDALAVKAAKKVFISAEKIVSTEDVRRKHHLTNILRIFVNGVVEAPYGAHPTSCNPHYSLDLAHMGEYAAAAKDEEGFQKYLEKYVLGAASPEQYLKRVGNLDKITITSA